MPVDTETLTTQHRIDALCEIALEPAEYCRKWVNVPPNERGYRKACVVALAEATGLSQRTINNWGSTFERRPEHILHVLRMADMLNQVKKSVLPPDYPTE